MLRLFRLGVLLLFFGGALFVTGYFSYKSYQDFVAQKKLQKTLRILDKTAEFEYAFLNEVNCRLNLTGSRGSERLCKQLEVTTNDISNELKQEVGVEYFGRFESKLLELRELFASYGILGVDKLIKGEIQLPTVKLAERYRKDFDFSGFAEGSRRILEALMRIGDVIRGSQIENLLVTYHLVRNKPMPPKRVLAWDRVVRSSNPDNLKSFEDIDALKTLLKRYGSEAMQKVLRKIESLRIEIMQKMQTGHYGVLATQWLKLSNQKIALFVKERKGIYRQIYQEIQNRHERTIRNLLAGMLSFFISMLAVIFWFVSWRQAGRYEKKIRELHKGVSFLHSFSSHQKALDVDLIVSKCKKMEADIEKERHDNQMMRFFIRRYAKELSRYGDMLQNHCLVLRDAPIKPEVKEFFEVLKIYSEGVKEVSFYCEKNEKDPYNLLQQGKKEQTTFNLLHMCEEVFERISNECARREIVYSLYIDPRLDCSVVGSRGYIREALHAIINAVFQQVSPFKEFAVEIERIDTRAGQTAVGFLFRYDGKMFDANDLRHFERATKETRLITPTERAIDWLVYADRFIRQLNGELELESGKQEQTHISFHLSLKVDADHAEALQGSDLKGKRVGVALPQTTHHRLAQEYLKRYLDVMGAKFEVFSYDRLEEIRHDTEKLPDVMLVYHRFAKLKGELDKFADLGCATVLITTPKFRALEPKIPIETVVYEPVVHRKLLRALGMVHKGEDVHKLEMLEQSSPQENATQAFPLRILLAESNRISRNLIMERLEMLGVEVVDTASAEEALELHKRYKYDFIFLAEDLPDQKGIETASKMAYYEKSKKRPHTPVAILVSDTALEERYIKLGADAVLSKRASLQEVKGLLERFEAQQAVEGLSREEDDTLELFGFDDLLNNHNGKV